MQDVKQEKNSIQGAVYQILRDGIMGLTLEPGKGISTQEMATRLNVSRTPVREAFIRLQREGLVNMLPQRETVISKIDVRHAMQESFIRIQLEYAIIEDAVANASTHMIRELKNNLEKQSECFEKDRVDQFVRIDNQFHGLIFKMADRSFAWDVIMNVTGNFNRLRVFYTEKHGIMSTVIEEHYEILKAIEEKNAEKLHLCYETHFATSNSRMEKALLKDLVREYPKYFSDGPEDFSVQIGQL